jgi:serine/threonine-protein phosphatase 6 regulatory ankyrin repeat subunit B
VEVVRELLKNGASMESVNNDGWTPLHIATNNGPVEVLRVLLKNGANIKSVNNYG